MPLVSVVTSVHNGEKYLKTAVQSILQQTFKDFEYLIVNDGSTDATADILEELADADQRIRVIHESHQGLTKSLNLAVSSGDSEYIARMDADDWSHPQRLSRQVAALEVSKLNVGICCTRAKIMHSGKVVPKYSTFVMYKHLMPILCPTIHGTFMVKRSALLAVGGYDERYPVSQDYKLLYDLESAGYTMRYLKSPLYALRIHEESISHRFAQSQQEYSLKIGYLFAKRRSSVTVGFLRTVQSGVIKMTGIRRKG